MDAEGDLLCRAIQHEIDHLDGELFIDKAVSPIAADLELVKAGFLEGDAKAIEEELHGSQTIKIGTQTPVIG